MECDLSKCKHIDDLEEEVLRLRLVMREVLSMFVNLGAIRNNNIVLQFSDDIDAEMVYGDITKKMGDCLPNAGAHRAAVADTVKSVVGASGSRWPKYGAPVDEPLSMDEGDVAAHLNSANMPLSDKTDKGGK